MSAVDPLAPRLDIVARRGLGSRELHVASPGEGMLQIETENDLREPGVLARLPRPRPASRTPTSPRSRKRKIEGDGHDFYPTPLWAVLALLERERMRGVVWECSCGDGEASMGLRMRGHDVVSSDLVDRGYGTPGVDFLQRQPARRIGTIFTNPPFKDAEIFVRRARSFVGVKVCMFMPLQFLQGAGRTDGLWAEDPPDRVLIVPERVTMYPRGKEQPGSGTHATSWYVWDGPARPGGATATSWLATGAPKRYGAATATLRRELLRRNALREAAGTAAA